MDKRTRHIALSDVTGDEVATSSAVAGRMYMWRGIKTMGLICSHVLEKTGRAIALQVGIRGMEMQLPLHVVGNDVFV
jgi:hypothetical protein